MVRAAQRLARKGSRPFGMALQRGPNPIVGPRDADPNLTLISLNLIIMRSSDVTFSIAMQLWGN